MSRRSHLAAAIAAISLAFCTTPGHTQESAASPAISASHAQDRLGAPVANSTSIDTGETPRAGTGAAGDQRTASPPTTATNLGSMELGTSSETAQAVGQQNAPVEAVDASTTTTADRQADLPHDLSPWGMFMAADVIVKAVMIGLAFASVVTWTVLIAKIIELGAVQRSVQRAVCNLTASQGLAAAEQIFADRRGIASQMVEAARAEMNSSDEVLDQVSDSGVKERVASRLQRMEVQAGRRIAKGTGLLATIGSTAPFVGLFGTVWGIMNSFIGISKAQTTNLAIVAPGIAEALLATAIGLVAAIPAVVIYNFLVRAITGYRQGLSDASAAIERLVSRDLDVRRARLAAHRSSGTARPDPALVRIG